MELVTGVESHCHVFRDALDCQVGTGECPGEKDVKIKALLQELCTVRAENVNLQAELDQLRASVAPDPAGNGGATDLSEEAIRKRLDRMCSYNAKGTLVSKKLVQADQ